MSLRNDSSWSDNDLEIDSFNFDIGEMLTSTGLAKSTLTFKPKQNILTQGGRADAVYFIKSGKVRLTVVSEHGREGVVAILGEWDSSSEKAAYPRLPSTPRPRLPWRRP